jgi:hypothetical protein
MGLLEVGWVWCGAELAAAERSKVDLIFGG